MKNKDCDYIEQARARHHAALKAMLPNGDTRTGRHVWRQLRNVECNAHRLAELVCNCGLEEEKLEIKKEFIKASVWKIFGGRLPNGFFVNMDPRGYALKLKPGSVPYALEQDWGGYQILAPEIN